MIRNDLKEKLPEDWREKFIHRDCDQANYEFAMFEIGGENKILVRNPDTDDIMEYYYDDFDGKISVSGFIESMGYKEQDRRKYYIDRDYNWYSNDKLKKNLKETVSISKRCDYPELGVYIEKESTIGVISFNQHRLIAWTFIPNSQPDNFSIVNHIDRNHKNILKENLEWCNTEYNNSSEHKNHFEFVVLYRRLSDNMIFSPDELKAEYSYEGAARLVRRSANTNIKYKNSNWEIINVALEDYLSRHPIDPNGWYDDNGLHDFGKHKVRANSCGILEVDGKLTVGHKRDITNVYTITINKRAFLLHRLIYEIISKKIIDEHNVIDHIKPSDKEDINNSYINLREVSQKENMQNEQTKISLSDKVCVFDLSGNFIEILDSGIATSVKYNIATSLISRSRSGELLQAGNYIFLSPEDSVKDRTDLLYYKISSSGQIISCKTVFGFSLFERKPDKKELPIMRKYLNTGIPAPDGYYYQQGDPKNMIYDPNNTSLTKKREEKNWKYRKKK